MRRIGKLVGVVLWWSAAGIAQAAGQTPDRTMVGVQDLAWSADGEKLFFSAMRVKPDYSDYTPEKWAVYSYTLATRELKLVAPAAFSVNTAPRGSRIVLGKLIDGNRDLLVLEADGREVARLTDHPAEDYGGAWSPDGRHIAFTSKRNGHSEVFVANADGSDPRRLVDAGAARTFSPSWSADGQYIAYYREIGDGQDQIHVVRADGSGDRNLTQDGFNNVFPGWTPDGMVVYGQGQRGRPTYAFTVKVDGSGKQPLLDIKSFFVRYAPDGNRIAYLEEHPEGEGMRIVFADRQGKVLTRVSLERVGVAP